MLSVLNIAAGGLQAASARLNVTAGNLANLDTAGYKARRANLTASAGGVAVGSVSADPSPGPVDADGVEGSNVDVTTEAVDLIVEKQQYTASAQLLKTGNQMLGTLLDVLAK